MVGRILAEPTDGCTDFGWTALWLDRIWLNRLMVGRILAEPTDGWTDIGWTDL
jgi:hypothetical protein